MFSNKASFVPTMYASGQKVMLKPSEVCYRVCCHNLI